jgi:APA family basic amino acid/polyamine antiporter
MVTATAATTIRLFVWMALGLALYFAYGRKHSKLRHESMT